MATKEWTHTDKSAWGTGAWQSEPDKVQWVDETTGLDCLIHRGPSGALCGYVGVAEGHPYFAKGYSSCVHEPPCEDYCPHRPDSLVEVHGGLTYSDFCAETVDESHGICHVPEEGRPHRVWWLGFDCAHGGDLCPGYASRIAGLMPRSGYETYKHRAYVEGEVRKLAAQLKAVDA